MCSKLSYQISIGIISLIISNGYTSAAKSDFQKHYSSANSYFEQKQYAKAIAEYEAAYAISKDSYLLFNIGQAHHRLGHYKEALTFYELFSKMEPEREPAIEGKLQRGLTEVKAAIESASSRQSLSREPSVSGVDDSSIPTTSSAERAPSISISSYPGQKFNVSLETAVGLKTCDFPVVSSIPCVFTSLPAGPVRINVKGDKIGRYSKEFELSRPGYTQVVIRDRGRTALWTGLGIMGIGSLQLVIGGGGMIGYRDYNGLALSVASISLGGSAFLAGGLMAAIEGGMGRTRLDIKEPPERSRSSTAVIFVGGD